MSGDVPVPYCPDAPRMAVTNRWRTSERRTVNDDAISSSGFDSAMRRLESGNAEVGIPPPPASQSGLPANPQHSQHQPSVWGGGVCVLCSSCRQLS
jgi:hypothetical protein